MNGKVKKVRHAGLASAAIPARRREKNASKVAFCAPRSKLAVDEAAC
jgi:hypothetical protein